MHRPRLLAGFLAVLAVVMLALLIGPPMPVAEERANCVVAFQLSPALRLLLNCDAAEFMRLAGDPAALLEPDNVRQSRPLLVVLPWLLAWPLRLLAGLLPEFSPEAVGPNARNQAQVAMALRTLVPAYLGYLTLNLATMAAAAWCVLRLLPVAGLATLATRLMLLSLLVLMIGNDVVKAFVWSPHTQLLNILVPLLMVTWLMRPPGRTGALLAAGLLGLGMLIYANMVLGLAGLFLGLLWRAWRQGGAPAVLRLAPLLAVCALLFMLPALAWARTVMHLTGSYHVAETAKYGQVVWITEAWANGPVALLLAALDKLLFFLAAAVQHAVPLLAMAVYAVWIGRRRLAGAPIPVDTAGLTSGLLAAALALSFYIVIGWEAARLANSAIPPLLWATAMLIAGAAAARPGLWRMRDAAVFGAIAIAQLVWTVAKPGPLS